MQQMHDQPQSHTDLFGDLDDPVATYLAFTREVMPAHAKRPEIHWPVTEDHCFQRIVLDTLFGDVWYKHLKRPAYRYLTQTQARAAVTICQEIMATRSDIVALNHASLRYRGKLR